MAVSVLQNAVDVTPDAAGVSADLQFEVRAVSGQLVAAVALPLGYTVSDLRQRVQHLLGPAEGDRLFLLGCDILGDSELLEQVARGQELPVQVTMVHSAAPAVAALVCYGNGRVELLDAEEGSVVRDLGADLSGVSLISANRPSHRALLGCSDGLMQLWDVDARQAAVREFDLGKTAVHLVVDWASMRALCAFEDGSISLLDLENGDVLLDHCSHRGSVFSCMDWDCSANLIACACGELIILLDLDSSDCLAELRGHCSRVTCIQADFRKAIAVSGSLALVRVWFQIFAGSGSVYKDLPLGYLGPVTCLAYNFTSGVAVAGAPDGQLRFWNSWHNAWVTANDIGRGTVTCLQAAWHMHRLLAGYVDGSVLLWTDGGVLVQASQCHSGREPVRSLAFYGAVAEPTCSHSEDYTAACRQWPAKSRVCSGTFVIVAISKKDAETEKFRLQLHTPLPKGCCRLCTVNLREHFKLHLGLLYTDRLCFVRCGGSRCGDLALANSDFLPAPPSAVRVDGPPSVVRMLVLALTRQTLQKGK